MMLIKVRLEPPTLILLISKTTTATKGPKYLYSDVKNSNIPKK